MNAVFKFFKELPGKVILWLLIGGTVAMIVLHFLAKSATLKAKEINLAALIQDAVDKLKISQRKEKIKELDKPQPTETDPKKVEEFYKNRK